MKLLLTSLMHHAQGLLAVHHAQGLLAMHPGTRAVSCAGHGSIKSILDDMKLLSTEAEGVNVAIPEADRPMLVNSAGRVGALLGLKSSEEGRALIHPY